jgi:hypothetical protein
MAPSTSATAASCSAPYSSTPADPTVLDHVELIVRQHRPLTRPAPALAVWSEQSGSASARAGMKAAGARSRRKCEETGGLPAGVHRIRRIEIGLFLAYLSLGPGDRTLARTYGSIAA